MHNNNIFGQVLSLLMISLDVHVVRLEAGQSYAVENLEDIKALIDLTLELIDKSENLAIAAIESEFESDSARVVNITKGVMSAEFDPKIGFKKGVVTLSAEESQRDALAALGQYEMKAVEQQRTRFAALRCELGELEIRIELALL